MTGAVVRCGDRTMGEVRLDAGKARRFGAEARSTDGFDSLSETRYAIFRYSSRPKGRSSLATNRNPVDVG